VLDRGLARGSDWACQLYTPQFLPQISGLISAH